MDSVKGKVVLITGASSGIGAATALEFAKYGSKLALTGRKKDNLEDVGHQCQEQGLSKDKVLLIIADMTKDEDIKNIVDTTVAKFGSIDVLVNNAGMTMLGDLQAMTMEDFDLIQRVNIRAVCYLTKLALPYIKQAKGNIVNISSLAGSRPLVNNIAYSMVKASLNTFTTSLALELAKDSVRVNAVNPGIIATSIFERSGFPPAVVQAFLAAAAKFIPLGRHGEPKEIGQTVVFLASEAASYITGTLLPIDGGLSPTGSWCTMGEMQL